MTSPFIYSNKVDASLPSALRSAGGSSAAMKVGNAHTVRAFLNVTAATAPTTMTVTLETSDDGSTGWIAIASFAAKTAAGQTERKAFSGLGEYVRWTWTMTATNFTFQVDAKLIGA